MGSIEKIKQQAAETIGNMVAKHGQKTKKAIPSAVEAVTPEKMLDAMDAMEQKSKVFIPGISIEKQLAYETVSEGIGYVTCKAEAEKLAKEAVNGAREIMYAMGRRDIPKSAELSYGTFDRAGIIEKEKQAELKARLQEKYGDKLAMKRHASEEFKLKSMAYDEVNNLLDKT